LQKQVLIYSSYNGFSNRNTEIKGKIGIFDIVPTYKLSLFGKEYKVMIFYKLPLVFLVQNQGKNLSNQKESNIQADWKKTEYDIIPQNSLANSQRVVKIQNH
jgi:hypothetical protein